MEASARYATAGSHTTELTVTDADKAVGSDSSTVTVLPVDPVCMKATGSVTQIWPPNHQFVDVAVTGVTAPSGSTPVVRVVGVRQDEPVDAVGDGSTGPDARIVTTSAGDRVQVLAERSGTGDGRVYTVLFEATTTDGGSCHGQVTVGVPHAVKEPVVDSGAWYDSLTTIAPPITTTPGQGADAALPDWYRTGTGTPLTVPAPGVLGNDLIPTGRSATVQVVTTPSSGRLVLAADGGFTFTPEKAGWVQFTYRARTTTGTGQAAWSAPATVSIDVDATTPVVACPGPAGRDGGRHPHHGDPARDYPDVRRYRPIHPR